MGESASVNAFMVYGCGCRSVYVWTFVIFGCEFECG